MKGRLLDVPSICISLTQAEPGAGGSPRLSAQGWAVPVGDGSQWFRGPTLALCKGLTDDSGPVAFVVRAWALKNPQA